MTFWRVCDNKVDFVVGNLSVISPGAQDHFEPPYCEHVKNDHCDTNNGSPRDPWNGLVPKCDQPGQDEPNREIDHDCPHSKHHVSGIGICYGAEGCVCSAGESDGQADRKEQKLSMNESEERGRNAVARPWRQAHHDTTCDDENDEREPADVTERPRGKEELCYRECIPVHLSLRCQRHE